MSSGLERRLARLMRLDWECRRRLAELHGQLKVAADELFVAGRTFEGVLETQEEDRIREAIKAIEHMLDREYLVHVLRQLEAERQRAKEVTEKLKAFSGLV